MEKNFATTSPFGRTHRTVGRLARLGAVIALVLVGIGGSSIAHADSNETSITDPNVGVNASFTVGELNACYILPSTSVKCWGYNAEGQVGDGTFVDATTPKDVVGLTDVKALTIAMQGCALTNAGVVKCWGTSKGNGTSNNSATPVEVTGFSAPVSAISSGANTVCAVLSTGGVECWGSNWWGQLGNGTQTDSLTPVPVTGLSSGVVSVSVGDYHTCALLSTGGVKCWGHGPSGQLGDNSNSSTRRLTPVQVTGLTSGVSAISAGMEHTCALLTTGAVKCWGRGDDGQIGDGANGSFLTPTQVTGLTSGVTSISTGSRHTCARLSTGTVKCWGNNGDGQLGDGTTTNSNIPVVVSGLEIGAKAVTAGAGQTCVILGDYDIRCFGANYYGGLGDGTQNSSSVPVKVQSLAPVVTTTTSTIAATSTTIKRISSSNKSRSLPSAGSHNNTSIAVAMTLLIAGFVILAGRRHVLQRTSSDQSRIDEKS